jgi:competence protein ComEA
MDIKQLEALFVKHFGSFLILLIVAGSSFVIGSQFGSNSSNTATNTTSVETVPATQSSAIADIQQSLASPETSSENTSVTTQNNAAPEQPGLISINNASLNQLDTLPGIGPAKAQAIIDYRIQNGPFVSIDSLTDVSGIGPATLEKIRPLVTL